MTRIQQAVDFHPIFHQCRRKLFSLTRWYYHLSRYGESIWRPTLAGLVNFISIDIILVDAIESSLNLRTKEIESWKGFANNLSSKEDRELFEKMLNDCYKYAAAINAKGQPFLSEPLIMALLLSQHKMIDWLTKQTSKYESHDNNNKLRNLKKTNKN